MSKQPRINPQKAQRRQLALAIGMALGAGTVQADFPPQFELAALNGSNGVVLNGAAAGDYAGQSVSAAGDFNGDGFDDLVIGAPYASNGAAFAGKAYVVFGSAQGLPNPLNLSTLDATSGLVIEGANVFDSVGASVSNAGDINGDGIDDLVIGAPNSSLGEYYAGAAFVVFGSNQGLPATLSVSSLDGTNGFAILGTTMFSSLGASVSGAGDVNGDGFDDLIIGAPFTPNGTAYVVFGSDQPWDPTLTVTALIGGNGFRIDGVNEADTLGQSVSGAGDINGDGIDDLVVGATLAGTPGAYAGAAYVVFGQRAAPTHPLDPSTLNGANGFALVGVSHGDSAGFSVSAAGDVNADGVDDLIIGAPQADPNGNGSGASYVIFGSTQAWGSSLNLASLNGTAGFALHGVSASDESGAAVGGIGDVNGDAIDDLVIGAPYADPNGDASGASYVVFGSNQAWPGTVALSSLDGANGFRANGVSVGDRSGTSVGAAGDINADGHADFLIGAPLADPNGAESGSAYLLHGVAAGAGDLIFADSFE